MRRLRPLALPPGAAGALEALALVVVIAAAGLLYARSLHTAANYDEGVYLASLHDLEAGDGLGSDVFASQPPGFYWLLRLFGLLFGDGLTGVRAGFLALSLLGLVAAWALARSLAGPAAGIVAATLLAVAPPYPTQAVLVEADTASAVLALAGLAVAVRSARRERATATAAVAGVLMGLAVLVKLSALTALVPLVALAAGMRPGRRETLAWLGGAALPFVAVALAYRSALPEIWHGAVSFHTEARTIAGPGTGDNAHRVSRFFDPHTPFGILAPLGLLATLAAAALRRASWTGLGALWTWTAAAIVFLIVQRPLFDHHLVLLAIAAAVPAGAALGATAARLPRPALKPLAAAALAVLLAAGYVQESRRLDRNRSAEPDEVRWAAARLRAGTPPGSRVATDLPIVAVLADRRVPGALVDTSYVRLESGDLTAAGFVREVQRTHPAAVVLGRELAHSPAVARAVAPGYPRTQTRGGITVLLPPARDS